MPNGSPARHPRWVEPKVIFLHDPRTTIAELLRGQWRSLSPDPLEGRSLNFRCFRQLAISNELSQYKVRHLDYDFPRVFQLSRRLAVGVLRLHVEVLAVCPINPDPDIQWPTHPNLEPCQPT